jgi:small subunit ribosomal protein S6
MAKLYDLMLLVDPNAPDGRQQEVVREAQSMVESGGTLVGAHDWGERRLAYEIDHRPEAHYHLFQFETEGNELLERLQHQLKILDGVLRFRIIRLKPGSPPPPVPRDSISRPREEREPEGRVAPRAAADAAPPESEGAVATEAPPVEEPLEEPPAEPPPLEEPPVETPPAEAAPGEEPPPGERE